MERDLYNQLLQWKENRYRKPLILQGARQVGKTHLLKHFAKTAFKDYVYINFEKNKKIHAFFANDLDPYRIVESLSIYFEMNINLAKTLIIFDEVQECPEALNSLKYFAEEAPEIHIAAAGSLLGVKLKNHRGFPVGKVDFLHLFPLSFFEFLSAIDKEKLRHYVESINGIAPIPEPIHEQLLELLKYYTIIGGMPEALKVYLQTQDLKQVREKQEAILNAYLLDFSKHADPHQVMKITGAWHSIPKQLAKENKKFMFSAIEKRARAREYETAIQWLIDAGVIYHCSSITAPKIPLSAYTDSKGFKIYLLDVGLLGAMADVPIKSLLEVDALFTEFKGALMENLVAQALKLTHKKSLYYWTEPSRAEIDFLIPVESHIYPLEVKAGKVVKQKSLRFYEDKYSPKYLLRASLMNLKREGNLCNYPLYLLQKLSKLI